MKRALILGVSGQDGSYLAEFLIEKGYEVHGVVRRSSSFNTARIDHLYTDPHDRGQLRLHFGDLSDGGSIQEVISKTRPDEIYNLGAQSHVRVSFDIPEYTSDVTGLGTIRILEAMRRENPDAKFYQASSSEMFGSSPPPQNESTPFSPRSPYGCAKAYAYYVAKNYREAYGIFACNGILFNHSSPRRGETFVERKITRAVGRIKHGLQKHLFLGNLTALRDWGHARDYVEAMWKMMQLGWSDDFVIGTGVTFSVQQCVDLAFGLAGLDPQDFVHQDPRYFRPSEVSALQADASKAKDVLVWTPRVTFHEMISEMVEADMELAAKEKRTAG